MTPKTSKKTAQGNGGKILKDLMESAGQGVSEKLTRKDFASEMNPRWCPGCGDYAILNATQAVMAEMGIPKERFVIVSGIGCSSRFPYYMNTYGMHTIHGRAPAVASGLKVARPDLDIWIVTGDGDGLSIGGNHLIHILRRNINVNILLFNNRIYGLTKGQYSPTSEFGKKTKSSPAGSPDRPFNPLALALGANATFVARTVDLYMPHMKQVLKAAANHPGTSFVEILQNCVIFNDGTFEYITEKAVRNDHDLMLEEGKPLIFGKERDKGIRLVKDGLEVVSLNDGITEEDLMVHDSTREDPAVAMMLAHMEDLPGRTIDRWPVPLGIFRRVEHQTYDAVVREQVDKAKEKKTDIQSLLESGDMWEVKK